MAASFIKTKRNYLAFSELPDAQTVLELLSEWFKDCNEYHPYKGLKYHSPRKYRKQMANLEMCPV